MAVLEYSSYHVTRLIILCTAQLESFIDLTILRSWYREIGGEKEEEREKIERRGKAKGR